MFNACMKLCDKVLPRLGFSEPSEYHTIISSIHYWLQVVYSTCSVRGSVLLVGTHIDMIHPNLKKLVRLQKKQSCLYLNRHYINVYLVMVMVLSLPWLEHAVSLFSQQQVP